MQICFIFSLANEVWSAVGFTLVICVVYCQLEREAKEETRVG